MPSQRTKKKKLRASDLIAFLKIAGFEGKFVEPGAAAANPSATANQAMNQAASQIASSKVSASSAASPSVSSSTNTTAKAQNTNLRPRPDSSFKIRDSFREISQQATTTKVQASEEQQQEKLDARDSINEEMVVAALQKYVAERKPEPTIAMALKTHRPVVEGENISIFIDNQLQLEKLKAIKIQLHNFLIKSVNNGYVSFEFKMFDDSTSKEEKKLFTASEKFEHFVKLNPAIADLKNIFGLELD